MYVPWRKSLNFFVSLGMVEILELLSFLFILKLSYSKPFHNTLNYAFTANIEKVMKLCNLGDKTFETDFSYMIDDIVKMGQNSCGKGLGSLLTLKERPRTFEESLPAGYR